MPDDHLERLAKLEAANTELARQLTELRSQVDHARVGGFRSMRDSRRCPACGAGALLHVRRAKEASYGGPIDLAITHEKSMWKGVVPRGPMESFSCRTCGLVEFHVLDFNDVTVDGEHVVAIEPEDAPPADGPFR